MGKTKTAFVGEGLPEGKPKREKKQKPEKVHIAGLKGGQRIKVIESEETSETQEAAVTQEEKKRIKPPKVRGKKYSEVKAKVNPSQTYALKEAVELAKETSFSSFDGTMELHLTLKKAKISQNVVLPFLAGREKKIEIASDETIEKLKAGKIDFDVLIATPEFMPKLVPFAKTLGPRGLMPNPKNKTLVNDINKAKDFSANTITLKTEKDAPLIHTTFGKVSMSTDDLTQNAEAILTALGGSKQIIKAYVKATMGPSVKTAV